MQPDRSDVDAQVLGFLPRPPRDMKHGVATDNGFARAGGDRKASAGDVQDARFDSGALYEAQSSAGYMA